MIERPHYLTAIQPFIGQDVIKVLTGMRRSGKSTILNAVKQQLEQSGVPSQNVISMDFESLKWEDAASGYQSLYREVMHQAEGVSGKVYLFFDEIQEVPSWERAIDSFRVDLDCDIYLTGSNSKLLSSELASLLTGRYVTIEVMPFSFGETIAATEGSSQEALPLYLTLGGLPFLSHISYAREASLSYLRDVYNSILLKDIVARRGFRNVEQLQRVLRYFVSEIGATYSVDNIVNTLKQAGQSVSRDSVYSYLDAASDAKLLSRVKRYDVKGKAILRGEEKVYLTDVGIREALLGSNEARIDLVLENVVFCELARRGYSVYVGRNGSREIDFVAERGSERVYVQVAYLLASEKTVEREFGAFEGIPDNFSKYVVTLDPINRSQNGIRHLHLTDFLLAEEW